MGSACTAARSRRTISAARYARKVLGPARGQLSSLNCRAHLGMLPVRNSPTASVNRRILIIDDNAAIHEDFRKVLSVQPEHSAQAALDILEADILGQDPPAAVRPEGKS